MYDLMCICFSVLEYYLERLKLFHAHTYLQLFCRIVYTLLGLSFISYATLKKLERYKNTKLPLGVSPVSF